jgi:hypothetical protein
MRFVLSNRSPEWGLGIVIAEPSPGRLDTLFLEGGRRLLIESKAALEPVDDADVPADSPLRKPAQWPGVEHRKHATASFGEMLKEFQSQYPEGFQDRAYIKAERDSKASAVERAGKLLARERLSGLVESGQYAECHRTAIECAKMTNLVLNSERSILAALPPAAHEAFALQLFELLHGTKDYAHQVESFADRFARYGLGKWTVATYFGFLLDPKERVFVKPTAVQRAAKALHRNLEYQAQPSALIYKRVVALCQDVRAQLDAAQLQPADMIDVQSFLWIGTGLRREVR